MAANADLFALLAEMKKFMEPGQEVMKKGQEEMKKGQEEMKNQIQSHVEKTVHDLRSFLVLCTYYSRFVRNLSAIARPLHKLTEARLNFNWTEECEKSFNSLKQSLITSPVLTYPRTDKEFILDTDASNEGIGAVLSQKIGNEGCVIAYFSKSLGKPERNYCVTRKELLGIVKSIEHFHYYLYGRKFLLRSDHASLRWRLNFTEPEGQIARWIQRLQEYEFEIQHQKGTSHGNADVLSRRPCKESRKHYTNAEKKFGIETDISVEETKFGGSTILARNRSGQSCNKNDIGNFGTPCTLRTVFYSGYAYHRLGTCILVPFPVTTKGNRYVLVLKDYFTKWPEEIPIPDQEASTVAEELVRSWISCYGVPMILNSDQGTIFNSALFTELCKLLGILKTRTTALHPESDGMVKRFNRTILNHLSLFVSKNQTDWDSHLPLFLLAYRSADHEVTAFAPAELLFG
ncbi:Retrovirus-related Pol polyprotein from transposon 297 [Araneus ventricosus]|uniref:RNA-directed DNA polymerase n=1 Tax=Araneus ventricosus TaxID=182803 RepID=A0A4Y2U811_ARAVE|nr:Retrovirus-related Pol polyprotein from transposon 297 [Araneus ventricosus]